MSGEKRNNGTAPPKEIKKSIMGRVMWTYLCFAAIAVAIVVMIVLTQFGANSRPLRNRSDRTSYKIMAVEASRGNIYSHNRMILATDSPSFTISLDFTVIEPSMFEENYMALADSLSRLFPKYSRSYFETRLKDIWAKAQSDEPGRMDQTLFGEKVNQLELDRMNNFPILEHGRFGGGFIHTKDPGRFRPYDRLAARTIGRPDWFDGRNTVSGFGLEKAFDSDLEGTDGRNRCVRLYSNVWVPVVDRDVNVEVQNGHDVITTIDVDLQDIVETELGRQILANNATCGTAMIMDVKTGEIRAISNLTRYGNQVVDDENHAVTLLSEPGSTFKVVSLMALLEDAGYEITRPIDIPRKTYYYQPKNRTRTYEVVDTESKPLGKSTLREVMEKSSNIGFVRMVDEAYRDKPEQFVDYVRSLGFDVPINMQLLGGRRPTIKDPTRARETGWDVLSLMKMSYGYAVELTPAHTLMLYNAIANNGRMVAPRLVTAVEQNGQAVKEFPVEVLNEKICSDRTLRTVQSTLEGVVERGTGSALKDAHYRVAGKTGTAQMLRPDHKAYEYADGSMDYLASFVGYFPVENPRYTCIVAIKTHRKKGSDTKYYGSQLALPVFRQIADRTFNLFTDTYSPLEYNRADTSVPMKGGHVRDIITVADRLSIATDAPSVDGRWAETTGRDGSIHTERIPTPEGLMPMVKGMGLKDAIYILERAGLQVTFSGMGRVTEQSVEPGKEIAHGDRVVLKLE